MSARRKDPARVRAGKRSRRKGKTWERFVANLLRPIFGEDVFRGHQDSRGGAAAGEGCDLEGTPFYIEARHEESYAWRKHLREAVAKATERGDVRPIVLIAKEDKKPPDWKVGKPGTPPIVIMQLDDWLALVGSIEARRARIHAIDSTVSPGLQAATPEYLRELERRGKRKS